MAKSIEITDRAARHLQRVLAEKARLPGQCLRLVTTASGAAGLILDMPRQEDSVIQISGEHMLLLHPLLLPLVKGATLDYAETAEGALLVLSRQGRYVESERSVLRHAM